MHMMAERNMALLLLLILVFGPAFSWVDAGPESSGTRAMSPHWAEVHMKFVHANMTDAAGIQVEIANYYLSPMSAVFGTTNSTGEVRLYVPAARAGPNRITAEDITGTHWWSENLMIEPEGRYDLQRTLGEPLPAANTLSGTVRNSTTGTPMAGVEVSFWGHDLEGRYVSGNAFSTSAGEYTFDLPDSEGPYAISGHIDGSEDFSAQMFMTPGEDEFTMDIWMVPDHQPMRSVFVKGFNSTTGSEMELQYASLNGQNADLDNAFAYASSYTPDSVTGYYELPVDMGEYNVRMATVKDPVKNVSFEMYNHVLVDGVDVTLDAQFPIPLEWRMVMTHIQDDSGPIYYGHSEYSLRVSENPEFMIRGESFADTGGNARIWVPAETEVQMELWYYSYSRETVIIPPGPASSTVHVNVTLVETDLYSPPTGKISVLVKDEATGYEMAGISVTGNAFDDELDRWLYFQGSTGSDGYLNKTVDAGHYSEIVLSSGLGTGTILDVTVPEDGSVNVSGTIQRRSFPADHVWVEFPLLSPEGVPVPGQPVTIRRVDGSGDVIVLSDQDGIVTAALPPGDHRIYIEEEYDCIRTRRSMWTMVGRDISITPESAELPPVVLYRTGPLVSVEGMVKDSVTGEVLPHQSLNGYSYHPLEDSGSRQMPYIMGYWEEFLGMKPPRVDLFWSSYSGSDPSGRYRVWGRENMVISAWREGYYPYDEEIDLGTRGDLDMDLLMEPLPERKVFVNGTLRDQDRYPIEGIVALLDVPHDHYVVGEEMVGPTGAFSIETYPGSLRVLFGNETLYDFIDIEVPPEGIPSLELLLVPHAVVNGTVVDTLGDPVGGLEVALYSSLPWAFEGVDVSWNNQTALTNASGYFSFNVTRGTHRVVIAPSGSYLGYDSGAMSTDGWNSFHLDIVLQDRTAGDLVGRVMAQGGPVQGGFPNATLVLRSGSGPARWNSTTGSDGAYSLKDLPYGSDYSLVATPPSHLLGSEGVRSGYLPSTIDNISISAWENPLDLYLVHITVGDEEHVNLTGWGPTGTGVPLNAPIWIGFTHAMDAGSVETAFSIVPTVGNLTFEWSQDGDLLTMGHDELSPLTSYSIVLSGDVLSRSGLGLYDPAGLTWSFTTGTETSEWYLTSGTVQVRSNRSWEIDAVGGPGQDVFIVIDGVGSFELTEGPPGRYRTTIPGDLFQWDTAYDYHFSDADGGPDRWPSLAGQGITPEGPDVEPPPVEVKDDRFPYALICLGSCGALLVVLLLAAVLLALMARSRKPRGAGEE